MLCLLQKHEHKFKTEELGKKVTKVHKDSNVEVQTFLLQISKP